MALARPQAHRRLTRPLTLVAAAALTLALPAGPAGAAPEVQPGVNAPGAWMVATGPDNNRAYTANWAPSGVTVVDANSSSAVDTISLPDNTSAVVGSPDGKYIYATTYTEGGDDVAEVHRIDATTDEVMDKTTIGDGPYGMGITPDGARLYIASYGANTVSVVDAKTMALIGSPIVMNAGSNLNGLAVAPDGEHVYTANYSGRSVGVIDTSTNTLTEDIPVSGDANVVWVTVSPDSKTLYVSLESAPGAVAIDLATKTQTSIDTGVTSDVYGSAVSPDGARLYVANRTTKNVSVIDTATNAIVGEPIDLGSGADPQGAAITPDGSRFYVAGGDPSLSVVALSPSQPQQPVAVAGEGLANISWTPPTFTGGQDISAYTVTSKPGGKTCTTSGDTSCSITGLTDGTEYTFTVTATNSIGTSIPSVPSNAVTANTPTPTPTPEPTPIPTPKKSQKPLNGKGQPPREIAQDGVTVLTKRNVRLSSGELMRTRVRVNDSQASSQGEVRYYRIIRGPQGKVSIRTYGYKGLKIIMLQSAPGTEVYKPYLKRTVYINGEKQ